MSSVHEERRGNAFESLGLYVTVLNIDTVSCEVDDEFKLGKCDKIVVELKSGDIRRANSEVEMQSSAEK